MWDIFYESLVIVENIFHYLKYSKNLILKIKMKTFWCPRRNNTVFILVRFKMKSFYNILLCYELCFWFANRDTSVVVFFLSRVNGSIEEQSVRKRKRKCRKFWLLRACSKSYSCSVCNNSLRLRQFVPYRVWWRGRNFQIPSRMGVRRTRILVKCTIVRLTRKTERPRNVSIY